MNIFIVVSLPREHYFFSGLLAFTYEIAFQMGYLFRKSSSKKGPSILRKTNAKTVMAKVTDNDKGLLYGNEKEDSYISKKAYLVIL